MADRTERTGAAEDKQQDGPAVRQTGGHSASAAAGEAALVRMLDRARPSGGAAPDPSAAAAVVAKVRDLLSYGGLDWVVTDKEVLLALDLLSTVGSAALPRVVKQLGELLVARLLDNLPRREEKEANTVRFLCACPLPIIAKHAGLLVNADFSWVKSEADKALLHNIAPYLAPADQARLNQTVADPRPASLDPILAEVERLRPSAQSAENAADAAVDAMWKLPLAARFALMARLNDERFTVWLDLVKREAPPTRFQQLLFVAERRRRAPYLTQFTFGGFFWLATSEEAQRLYQILPELNRADEARIRATVPTSVAAELARLSGGAEYRSGGLYGGDISPELSLKTILGVSETCGSMADLRARWRLFPEGVRLQLLRQFPRRSSFDEALVRVLCAGDGAERKEFAADLLLPDGWGWLAGGMPDEEVAYLQRALDELTVEQRRQASRLLGPNVRSQLAKLQTRMQTSALFSNDEELKRAFDRTADASVDVLAELADERFSMRFVGLDATALRRAWKVLEGLPAAQVARALELVGGLDPSKGAVGEWRGDQIAIADIAKLGTGEDRTTFNRHGIHKDRRFDQVLRHEVGHAVDEELGASATYCKTEAGGGWREHADMPALAREMILHSNSVIAHWPDPAQRELLIQALAEAIPREGAAPADYLAPVYALQGTFPKAEFSKLFDDPVFEAIRRGRDSEWWNGYPALGPRCYSKSHYGGWQSYLAAARDRKVSVYQFFASPEWFAEAYAAFYAPGYGDDPAKDNALLRVDPGSHVYFMTHVHTHQRKGES